MATTRKTRRCDSCQLVRINGTVCHETGCPKAWQSGTVDCRNCGRTFRPGSPETARSRLCSGGCRRSFYG